MSNLDDLRSWPDNNLPVSAEWSTGHGIDWNVDQIQSGHRLLPTFINYIFSEDTQKKVDQKVNPFAADFAYISDNAIGLILRHQSNIASDLSNDRGTYPDNTLVEWRLVNGVLDSRPICDHLANPSLWATKGTVYASGLVNTRIKQLTPGVPWIGFFDNHEVGHETGKVGSVPVGQQPHREWMTTTQLEDISLTLRDKVTELGFQSDPFDYVPEIFLKQEEQYKAFFNSFGGAFNKPILSAAYSATGFGGAVPQSVIDVVGPVGDALAYNAGGPSCYITGSATDLFHPGNLTDIAIYTPGWEWMEAHEEGRFRIVFVSIGEGAAEGPHGTTTPALFQAWCEWVAWQSRAANGGQPLLLEHWIGSSTTPTTPFGSTIYTHSDYSIAPAKACDSICRPIVRDYWLTGVNVQSTCSNTQVRIVAVKRDANYLVFAWSPYVISEVDLPIVVDGISCTIRTPSAGVSYWILSPPPPTSLIGTRLE